MTIHYLDFNGTPVIHDDTYAKLPRRLVNREWVRVYDTRPVFMDSVTITKEEFDRMVAELGGPADPWREEPEQTEGGQS